MKTTGAGQEGRDGENTPPRLLRPTGQRASIRRSLLLTLTALLLAGNAPTAMAQSIVVTISGYKHKFKGGGCQSTMYGNQMGSLSDTEKAQAMDWLFCDLNMGYLRDNRYVSERLARGPNLNLHAYQAVSSSLEVNGKLNIADPQVYNKLATNWFNYLRDQHAAGEDVNIARLLNEPDYAENQNPGELGYSGNPQKGFALIIDRAVARLVDMLANPAINTTGVPRPLFMFPNTLDAGACVSYLSEIKKTSSYPRGWGLVDIVATHQYGNGASSSVFSGIASAASGRRMIVSEMYPNRGDSLGSLPIDSKTRAVLSLAQLISIPVNAGFDSWWYWQINYDGDTPLALLAIPWGSVSRPKHYWAFLQLTSLQPYDSYVLSRSVSGLGNVSVIAMREQGAPHVTLSVANNEGSTKTAAIQLKSGSAIVTPHAYYQYLTDSNNNMTVTGPVLVTPGASTFNLQLRRYSLTSLRILLNPPADVPAALAHWGLDDASGTVALDSSGNARHAALGANNTWTSGMNGGGAVQFPADYYPATANHNLGSVTQLTYGAWFKRGAPTGNQEFGGSTGANPWKVLQYISANALRVSLGSDNWDTSVQATTNEWHHLVLTIDVPTRTVRLYLDGVLRSSTVRPAMAPITLGSSYWGARVNGPMDDVWLFNSVLNQSQVEKLHAASLIFVPPTPATTTTTLTSSANPSLWGSNVTFTATVRANGAIAAGAGGTVVLKDGSTALATNTLSEGVASFTAALANGSHSMTAQYSGQPLYFLASTSPPLTQVVSGTPVATTTALAASSNPSPVGSSVTFTATVKAGGATATSAAGTMVFRNGTNAVSTNAVSGGIATFTTSGLAYGSHLVKAEYAGHGLHLASTSSPLAQLVLNGTPTSTALAVSPSPSVASEEVTLTATITPAVTNGTVVFKDGATALSTNAVSNGSAGFTTSALGFGSHSLTAQYSGYGLNLTSTSSPAWSHSVVRLATTTLVGTSPNPSPLGGAVALTAIIKANGLMAINAGGTVVFKAGNTPLSTNAVVGGLAAGETSSLAFGSHLITAQYSGDATYLASTSPPLAQIVLNPAPTTTVIGSFPNPSLLDEDFIVTATVQTNGQTAVEAGGTMVLKDGPTVLGESLISQGVGSFTISGLTVGSHSLTAEYSGHGIYLASTSALLAQLVQLPPAELTWDVAGDQVNLAWPSHYLGWILQSQTNVLGVGLDTNWTDIPGTATVISTNLPLVRSNPPVFYRLRNP